MTEQALKDLAARLGALSVFRGVLRKEPLAALLRYLCSEEPPFLRAAHYGAFVGALTEDGCSLSAFLRRAVYADENPYVIGTARGEAIPAVLAANANAELALFSALTRLDAEALCEPLGGVGALPRFDSEPVDFAAEYADRLRHIDRFGYGVFSEAGMFFLRDGEVFPVRSADTISADHFIGYEDERKKVFDNTQMLVRGKPAANILLFGDAGTGKSSTVKACANYFCDRGVRLIELRKDQLFYLTDLMGRIADNPLKFIIFIDDLSFNKNDDNFSMLKAALEGSASARARNAVIYATSNRRHIVKETFSDRATGGDDIHRNDTVQELMSLSDRFGLTVYFEKPNKQLYLEIVHQLARRAELSSDPAELDRQAEAFALGKGSRSPRTAEQFIQSILP